MIEFKMPFVIKFSGNGFYTSCTIEPNFRTIFLADDYYDSCIIHLHDKNNNPMYLSCVEYILHSKHLELNPTIDPDYFWELRQ
jgi:hypothetical protein